MNDNDIIKALEHCKNKRCIICPYDDIANTFDGCSTKLIEDAINLINRLKAEIEDSTEIVYTCRTDKFKKIKVDAIKEFAEKLKEKVYYVQESEWDGYVVDCEDIDNLVEEMTDE